MNQMTLHEENMRYLIKYAIDNGTEPYASSIYDKNNKLLAIAMGDKNSPINHAEIKVINECAKLHPDITWSELTMYTTGEPNCMCAAACCWSNLKTVVYATDIPFMIELWGIESPLRARDIIAAHPKRPTLIGNVCAAEGKDLFLRYKDLFAKTWNEKRWELNQCVN